MLGLIRFIIFGPEKPSASVVALEAAQKDIKALQASIADERDRRLSSMSSIRKTVSDSAEALNERISAVEEVNNAAANDIFNLAGRVTEAEAKLDSPALDMTAITNKADQALQDSAAARESVNEQNAAIAEIRAESDATGRQAQIAQEASGQARQAAERAEEKADNAVQSAANLGSSITGFENRLNEVEDKVKDFEERIEEVE